MVMKSLLVGKLRSSGKHNSYVPGKLLRALPGKNIEK